LQKDVSVLPLMGKTSQAQRIRDTTASRS